MKQKLESLIRSSAVSSSGVLDKLSAFDDRQFAETLIDIAFTDTAVKKKLKAVKVNKSPGSDGHYPLVLKELTDELALPIAIVYKKSLSEGCLRQEWKDDHISLIFKKGKKSVPGNYRPVSLRSIICKVIESLVRDHIVHHMTSNQPLADNQHGFIHGHSCANNLLAVLDA